MSGGGGVFAVDRGLWDDPDFRDEPFSEREAWLWLVGNASWKERDARGNAGSVHLQRGEFSFALTFLAKRWHWSKSATDRFIQKLEKRGTIKDTSRDGSKIYSVCNYNKFQTIGKPNRDASGTRADTTPKRQRDELKAGKHESTKTGSLRSPVSPEAAPPPSAVVAMPLVDGSEFPISQNLITDFEKAYPAVKVAQELQAMRMWSITNPTHRKTKTGVMRFINAWLSKAQDRGGRGLATPTLVGSPRGGLGGIGDGKVYRLFDDAKEKA